MPIFWARFARGIKNTIFFVKIFTKKFNQGGTLSNFSYIRPQYITKGGPLEILKNFQGLPPLGKIPGDAHDVVFDFLILCFVIDY